MRDLLREGLDAGRRTLVSAGVAELQIETDESLQINLDGEPIAGTRFRFELLPRRLRMKLPPDCPSIG